MGPRAVGQVTLRDFKQLFDRPGFFRYHFKTMDKEFGMVKEEIADDDQLLPGVEGKIVVWVGRNDLDLTSFAYFDNFLDFAKLRRSWLELVNKNNYPRVTKPSKKEKEEICQYSAIALHPS